MSFIQGAKNFIGGVNDTMNYPAVGIGELGAFLSPRGSKAEYYFKDFANSARNTSDMGQNRSSGTYLLGRVAPGLAVYGAFPAWSATLGVPATLGIETAGLSTLGGVYGGDIKDAYNWQQAGNSLYVNQGHGSAPQTSLTGRKIITNKELANSFPTNRNVLKKVDVQGTIDKSQKAKTLIANTLKAMKKSGQLGAQPTVAKSLINLYKKLK